MPINLSSFFVEPVAHAGRARLGARVRPGWFVQTHEHPELRGRTLLEILHRGDDHRHEPRLFPERLPDDDGKHQMRRARRLGRASIGVGEQFLEDAQVAGLLGRPPKPRLDRVAARSRRERSRMELGPAACGSDRKEPDNSQDPGNSLVPSADAT